MILEEETYKKFEYYSRELPPKSNKKIIVACEDCGEIRVIAKQNYRTFCRACSFKGAKNPSWKGGRIKQTCLECGKLFYAKRFKVNRGMGKYCSQKCFGKGLSRNNKCEKNGNWRGGISFKPYCHKFDNTFKEYIRNKFDRKCFLCDRTEEENGKRLSVHHVNYDKNCGCAETEEDKKADNVTCQFVPLCVSCNSKVNRNRKMWERKIKNKMKNKLNGWYI